VQHFTSACASQKYAEVSQEGGGGDEKPMARKFKNNCFHFNCFHTLGAVTMLWFYILPKKKREKVHYKSYYLELQNPIIMALMLLP
jgi:hypothetical protein